MRRNCNLELRLFPFSDSDHNDQQHQQHQEQQQQQQPLTIFYNGNVCVCDVTEIQARAILLLASKEMEDKMRTSSEPSSPTLSPIPSPSNNGLSMKRSLQMFLQKRNHRIQSTYPYSINRHGTCRVDH